MIKFTPEQWVVVEKLLELYGNYLEAQDYAHGDRVTDISGAEDNLKTTSDVFEAYKAQFAPKE